MASQADLILRATVQSKTCQRDPQGRIFTKIEVQIKEVWKGNPSQNPFVIVQGGGTLGEERVVVSGQAEYGIGEEIVAFLVLNDRSEGVTLGLAQGKFRVFQGKTSGQLLVQNLFHGADESAVAVGPQTVSPGRLTLDALRSQVREAKK